MIKGRKPKINGRVPQRNYIARPNSVYIAQQPIYPQPYIRPTPEEYLKYGYFGTGYGPFYDNRSYADVNDSTVLARVNDNGRNDKYTLQPVSRKFADSIVERNKLNAEGERFNLLGKTYIKPRRTLEMGGKPEEPTMSVTLPAVTIKRSEDPLWKLRQHINPNTNLYKDLGVVYDTGYTTEIWPRYRDKNGNKRPFIPNRMDKAAMQRLLNVYDFAKKQRRNFYVANNPSVDHAFTYRSSNPNHKVAMNVDNVEQFISELAHPIQDVYGKLNPFTEHDMVKTVNPLKIKSFNKTYYIGGENQRSKPNYSYADRFEHETHRAFEPKLRSYIFDNKYNNILDAIRSAQIAGANMRRYQALQQMHPNRKLSKAELKWNNNAINTDTALIPGYFFHTDRSN